MLSACAVVGIAAAVAAVRGKAVVPMTSIRVFIAGKPLPKGRPRVVNGRAYTDPVTRGYEAFLRVAFGNLAGQHRWAPPAGDVGVVIELRFASGIHGDVDNCAKAILDAAQGVLFRDDKCVRALHVWRRWADEQHPEGFELTVTALADDVRPKAPRKPRKRAA